MSTPYTTELVVTGDAFARTRTVRVTDLDSGHGGTIQHGETFAPVAANLLAA